MAGAILTKIQCFAAHHIQQREIRTAHTVERDLLRLSFAEVLSLGDHWQGDSELVILIEVHQRITFASGEVFAFAEGIEPAADLANDAAAETGRLDMELCHSAFRKCWTAMQFA
jgi:hypothetical protein